MYNTDKYIYILIGIRFCRVRVKVIVRFKNYILKIRGLVNLIIIINNFLLEEKKKQLVVVV